MEDEARTTPNEIKRFELELKEARAAILSAETEAHQNHVRAQQSEAQSAAMRGALINAKALWGFLSTDPSQKIWLETVEAALSTDAGRKMLDVVEAARKVDEFVMALIVALRDARPQHNQKFINEISWSSVKLSKAIAAMGK